jgi:hypothetical protein
MVEANLVIVITELHLYSHLAFVKGVYGPFESADSARKWIKEKGLASGDNEGWHICELHDGFRAPLKNGAE